MEWNLSLEIVSSCSSLLNFMKFYLNAKVSVLCAILDYS